MKFENTTLPMIGEFQTFMQEWVQEEIRKELTRREVIVRDLLGKWVSELEPAIFIKRGQFFPFDEELWGIGWVHGDHPTIYAGETCTQRT